MDVFYSVNEHGAVVGTAAAGGHVVVGRTLSAARRAMLDEIGRIRAEHFVTTDVWERVLDGDDE
jgi:hypothetical protein